MIDHGPANQERTSVRQFGRVAHIGPANSPLLIRHNLQVVRHASTSVFKGGALYLLDRLPRCEPLTWVGANQYCAGLTRPKGHDTGEVLGFRGLKFAQLDLANRRRWLHTVHSSLRGRAGAPWCRRLGIALRD